MKTKASKEIKMWMHQRENDIINICAYRIEAHKRLCELHKSIAIAEALHPEWMKGKFGKHLAEIKDSAAKLGKP